MKSWLPFVLSMLCASVAFAEPPAPPATPTQTAVTEMVDKQLLAPMKKAEGKRKRFSRAAPVPTARRVRVLDNEALTDARGKTFVRFAVDVRYGFNEKGEWNEHMQGCAYPSEGEVYVKNGDEREFVPARAMLGKDTKRRTDVCTASTVASAEVARS